jgi:hypothetical protein
MYYEPLCLFARLEAEVKGTGTWTQGDPFSTDFISMVHQAHVIRSDEIVLNPFPDLQKNWEHRLRQGEKGTGITSM